METQEFVQQYLDEMVAIARESNRVELTRFIDALFAAWSRGATVFCCGNGGSAGTASHLAADLAKYTWHEGKPRLRALSLCENVSLLSALTNDDGFDKIYSWQLESLMRPGDVLIAISVHGGKGADKAGAWSQNLLRAVHYAKSHGGTVLGLAGFDGGALKELADVCVVVPARSTPHVEAFHVCYHHMIAQRLRDLIGAAKA
jgi:D-sedoheptulose 7-phosphate isomerase